jgi:uncharacterized protein YjcR
MISKFKKPSAIDVEKFENLYHAGLAPSEIAEKFGVRRSKLAQWMRDHGYQRLCPAHQEIARQMYDERASDLDIAMRINCHVSAVSNWRAKNKLKKLNWVRTDGCEQ